MRRIPQIKSVMTPFPYSIAPDASLLEARRMMDTHEIRHLPVKEGNALLGVITDADIRLMWGPQPDHERKVRDAYIPHAYTVELTEPLDNVLAHMAAHHIGSAIVTKHGKLVGLFTVTDACRCFGEFLREQFLPGGGDEAA
jgi:acetoin utilization protein AcuB